MHIRVQYRGRLGLRIAFESSDYKCRGIREKNRLLVMLRRIMPSNFFTGDNRFHGFRLGV